MSKETACASPIAPTRYNSVINACAKAGDWALTLWLFSEIKAAGLKADIQSFNAALDACTKGSNPEAALALLKRMRSQGLAPDAISYQSAISACRAGGDGASAVMLLKDMDKQGLEPRDGDYNLVIETVGKEGDWGGALELIKRMKADGLTPDAYTYGAAVGACAKVQRLSAGCACRFASPFAVLGLISIPGLVFDALSRTARVLCVWDPPVHAFWPEIPPGASVLGITIFLFFLCPSFLSCDRDVIL